jgi:hypothetical protein
MPVVLAPSDGSPWIKRALLADPDVDLMGTSLAGLAKATVPPDALVVIDGACPATIPGADLLIVNPPPGKCRTAVVGKKLDHPRITSWSEADARLRFLTLDGVEVTQAHDIETEGPADALVHAREGTLVSDVSSPGRAGTLVSFDVGDSNWPLRASFVLFVRNVVELARAHRARGITGPARTGEPLSIRVPPEVGDITVEDPAKKETRVPARGGLAVVPEASRAGFYFVSWKGPHPGSLLVPANLTSETESNVVPRELATGGAPVKVSGAATVAEAHTSWTWVLAALALVFLALDVWWLTRRPRVAAPVSPVPRLPERQSNRRAA